MKIQPCMRTVNQAMKGRKIKKKITKIHSSCVFFCPTYTFVLSVSVQHDIDNSSNQCHSFRAVSSGRQGGQSSPPPPAPKFWTGRTITEYFFQYNPVIIAGPYSSYMYGSVWQRGGGGKCPP